MKLWKRNAIVATILVLVCAGIYFNWSINQPEPIDFTETLHAEQVLDGGPMPVSDVGTETAEPTAADSFAQIRLSRQESRDGAVELLQETIAYEDGSESAAAAVISLDDIVSDALAESEIESMVIAKGYEDCVAYMGENDISVAVSAPENGLEQADVALISDIVTTQTDYTLEQVRIIEVK